MFYRADPIKVITASSEVLEILYYLVNGKHAGKYALAEVSESGTLIVQYDNIAKISMKDKVLVNSLSTDDEYALNQLGYTANLTKLE